MRKIAWRLLPLLGAAAAVLGLALGSAPASASTAAPAHRGRRRRQHYSPESLAGFSSAGNGPWTSRAWRQITVVPAEPVHDPADTVAIGHHHGAEPERRGSEAYGEGWC